MLEGTESLLCYRQPTNEAYFFLKLCLKHSVGKKSSCLLSVELSSCDHFLSCYPHTLVEISHGFSEKLLWLKVLHGSSPV